ncbi:MAG: hypothetical protein J6D47_18220 [Peptostreptococcaceae bacterium]|nr:hypothetical protein [Peptostreptococcaceae bacterium]
MSKRVNITVSDEMIEFYQKQADEMGIPRSAAMVMGMKAYMDQQNSLRVAEIYKSMEKLVDQLELLKDEKENQ